MIEIPDYMGEPTHDLGMDHWLWLNDKHDSGEYMHPNAATGEACHGGIRIRPGGWVLEKLDPLTISPSLLCSCGDHGWIRDGRWVAA